jgi:hypothetical protein
MAHDYRAGRRFESLVLRAGRANQASQGRRGKFGRRDKWSSCLTAVSMAADQERWCRNESAETTALIARFGSFAEVVSARPERFLSRWADAPQSNVIQMPCLGRSVTIPIGLTS